MARVLAERGHLVRRAALRACGCPHDAEDATQLAAEIALEKAPLLEEGELCAWLIVVARREASRLARRRRLPLGEPGDRGDPGADPAERILVVLGAADRLALLKHDERRALILRAAGFSYLEIAARMGWTYTKVNRALAEGRARLRAAEEEAGG